MTATDSAYALLKYAECVFEQHDFVNLRFIPHDNRDVLNDHCIARDIGGLVGKCSQLNLDGYSIYAGPNPRKFKGGQKNVDVQLARCLFVEWDGVSVECAKQKRIAAGLPEPTLLLMSGAGPHAYWRLTEPIEDLEQWTNLQKRLIAALGSDNIKDLARVMRLPGFINRKPERGQLVALLDCDPSRRYSLAEIEAILPKLTCDEQPVPFDELPDIQRDEFGEGGNGLKPGEDFNQRGDVREVLLRTGWKSVEKFGDVEHWRRPGKDYGISGSLKGKGFCCFTTSTAIPSSLATNKGYSPFAVLTYLEHKGAFKAATRALAAAGYGVQHKSKPSRKLSLPEPFRPFPVEALPSICSEYVRQAATSIDCDQSMVALPLLAGIAAAIGNSCRIQLKKDYSEPSVLWTVNACESGSRKSAALESPLRPIRRREREEIKNFQSQLQYYCTAMQNFRAASSNWQRKGKKSGEAPPVEPEKPACHRFTVSDITVEALAVRLEQNPRGLLLVRDELAGFFTSLNQYKGGGKGGDEAAFLAMHGARSLVVDRKNLDRPSIYVPLANLSITGTIQPGILRRVFTRDRMESGMAARFLLAYPPPRAVRWREKSIDSVVQDRLTTMFEWLYSLPMGTDEQTNEPAPALLPLTSDAKQLWIAFHDEHAAEQAYLHGDLAAAWAKLTGYAARLSLVCQLAAWASGEDWTLPTEVGVEAVEAGITLAKWFSAETKRTYAILEESDEQRDVRQLIDFVRQHGGMITARDLSRGPRRYRGCIEAAEEALQGLVTAGWGRWVPIPATEQGGRPSRLFCMLEMPPGDETSMITCEIEDSVAVATQQNGADEEHEEWTL